MICIDYIVVDDASIKAITEVRNFGVWCDNN